MCVLETTKQIIFHLKLKQVVIYYFCFSLNPSSSPPTAFLLLQQILSYRIFNVTTIDYITICLTYTQCLHIFFLFLSFLLFSLCHCRSALLPHFLFSFFFVRSDFFITIFFIFPFSLFCSQCASSSYFVLFFLIPSSSARIIKIFS